MSNINNSIDGIDCSKYLSSTLDGIDFNKYSSSTVYSDSSLNGTIDTWSDGIPVQIVKTDPNDVIMCQISDDIDMDEYKMIYQELKKVFPNNDILLVNSNVVKNITIFKPKEEIVPPFLERDTYLNTTERSYGINDILY